MGQLSYKPRPGNMPALALQLLRNGPMTPDALCRAINAAKGTLPAILGLAIEHGRVIRVKSRNGILHYALAGTVLNEEFSAYGFRKEDDGQIGRALTDAPLVRSVTAPRIEVTSTALIIADPFGLAAQRIAKNKKVINQSPDQMATTTQEREHYMSTAQQATVIPEGYRKDAQGRLVPETMIKPIDMERDRLVQELIKSAQGLSSQIADFKIQVFGDVGAFVQLSAEQYDTKLGGKKGNVTLYSYDGRYKVQVATADNITFDERLQAAKSLIDECIADWSKGSSPEIQVLVQEAFQTDKEGNLNTGRILGLRRLEITDERWQRAMKAIGESVQVVGSKQYVRFYERVGDTDQYAPISLDIAAV